MNKEGARHQKWKQLHKRLTQVVPLQLPAAGAGVMPTVAMTVLSYPEVHKAIDVLEAIG